MNLKKYFEIIKYWFTKLCLNLKHKSVEEIIVTDINQIKFDVGDIILLTPDNYKLLVGCLIQQGYYNNDLTELTKDIRQQVMIELLPYESIIPCLPDDARHIKYYILDGCDNEYPIPVKYLSYQMLQNLGYETYVIVTESNSENLKDFLYDLDYSWAGGDSIIEFWPNTGYIIEISPRTHRLRYAYDIWHMSDYGKHLVINPEVYKIEL